MNKAEFIQYLLKVKVINKQVLEESKNINDFPHAYSIMLSIDGSDFINTLLNPKQYGEIDLASGDLKKHNLIGKSEYKEEAIKFINELSKQAKLKFRFENYKESSYSKKNKEKGKDIVIGIDLGTTNTLASFIENDKAVTIPLKNGERILPSVLSINKKNKFEIGENALRQRVSNPEETFFSVKRFIGRRSSEFNSSFVKQYPFKIDLEQDKVGIYSKRLERRFECEELSAQILLSLKINAERFLDQSVQKCIITVPAYFDNNQRVATKRAAEIAGLEVLRLISEPTAAAFAYGITKKNKNSVTLVMDLGGGTFDISLVRSDGEELDSFSVIAHSGERDLGGDDYTNVLIESIIKSIKKEIPTININTSISNLIRDEATKAKHLISFQDEVEINFPMLPTDDNKIESHTYILTKSKFERLTKKLNSELEEVIHNFLEFEKVKKYPFQKVVLVGGASRMEYFVKTVKKLTKIEPQIDVNPDEIVAHGAAYCGEYVVSNSPEKTVIDVTPLSLGIKVLGDIHSEIIPANTNLPCRKSEQYTTIEDYQRSMSIKIFQGNRKLASDNILLNKFVLNDIQKAKANIPKIEVTFEIDLDGILKVDAIDEMTNAKNSILISNSLDISSDEVEKLKNIAIEMSDDDTKKMHFAEKCNELYSWNRIFLDLEDPVLSFNEKLIIEKVNDCLENLHESSEDPVELIKKIKKIINKQDL